MPAVGSKERKKVGPMIEDQTPEQQNKKNGERWACAKRESSIYY
jgi:hypothetical protein